jgi:N-acetylglucosaminyl-diphospho-decaprenol L-rhamnosyltransferase
VLLTYGVVNTNGRDHLERCLDAIERTHPAGLGRQVIVVDNASDDGSVDYLRTRDVEVIALDKRTGKAENDSTLLKRAKGEYALLLNEDSELLDGTAAALVKEMDDDPRAAIVAATLLDPEGNPQPTAWRFPSWKTALVGAVFLHRRFTVQGPGIVDWAQSSAMLVRVKAAAEVGYLDPEFFVYSDETDFQKRLADAGWHARLSTARAIHHEQLTADTSPRRIVEFHRNRDLYMRKHHSKPEALLVRVLTAWAYAVRAIFSSGQQRGRYRLHALQALLPSRGEGIRDAAVEYNRR